MWARSLGWQDSLEEGVATHSSVLAWRTPRTEEPSGLQSMGSQRVRHAWSNLAHMSIISINQKEKQACCCLYNRFLKWEGGILTNAYYLVSRLKARDV